MGFKLDGIATNSALDSSGETMDVKGHDISDLIEGRGVLNWEHQNDSSEDIIGAVVYAKKIYKLSDCENDRQKKFLKLSGGPYVYVIAELFDDEEHPGAIAAAALIRYYHRRKVKILAGFSIEGHTLDRQGSHLARSVGRRVALTLRPCNKSCVTDVLDDPVLADVYKKTTKKSESTIPLYEMDDIILADPFEEILSNVEALNKTLTAGNYDAAPSSLTGGAALQVCSATKNRLKAALRDWNRTKPLKEIVKAALPEIGEDYVDHFVDVAEDMILKKSHQEGVRISAKHSAVPDIDEPQRQLLEGLYINEDTHTTQNDSGGDVIIKKPAHNRMKMDSGLAASAYSGAARDVFGLHEHVPVASHFRHDLLTRDTPTLSYSATEKRKGARSGFDPAVQFDSVFQKGVETGDLYKLGLIDTILGINDRHLGNIMVDADGRMMHTDNEDAFTYPESRHPLVAVPDLYNSPVPAEVVQWLQGIDPALLVHRLSRAGVDPDNIKRAVVQLRLAQRRAQSGVPFGGIINVGVQGGEE